MHTLEISIYEFQISNFLPLNCSYQKEILNYGFPNTNNYHVITAKSRLEIFIPYIFNVMQKANQMKLVLVVTHSKLKEKHKRRE